MVFSALGLDAAARPRERVQPAGLLATSGLRDVDASRGELALEFGALEFKLARFDQGADLVAHRIDACAGFAALVRREPPQRLELRGDRTLLAEELDLERLEVGEARGGGDARAGRVGELLQVGG